MEELSLITNNTTACKGEVFVIDSPCGFGKTQFAIQNLIWAEKGKKFIYITPYNSEVARVKEQCTKYGVEVYEPEAKGKTKYGKKKTKKMSFKELIMKGCNIITTHAMFDKIDETVIDLLKGHNYVLYLDEVHEVIKEHTLDKKDFELLIDSRYITIDKESGLVKWVEDKYDTYEGKFTQFKNLCDLGAMYYYGGKLFMWCFPIKVFEVMSKTYILTYLFEGQLQSSYYKLHNVKYEKKWVKQDGLYYLVDYKEEYNKEYIATIRDKINIYEGKLNYDKGITLTSSWFERADKDILRVVRNNTYNYFKHIVKGKADTILWTTLQNYQETLQYKGYVGSFIELNARATNEYKDRYNLAYVYNRYMKPTIYNFLTSQGIKVNEDLYAIGDFIQWIYRSRIREGQPINIYIPAERMRRLLKRYLGK